MKAAAGKPPQPRNRPFLGATVSREALDYLKEVAAAANQPISVVVDRVICEHKARNSG